MFRQENNYVLNKFSFMADLLPYILKRTCNFTLVHINIPVTWGNFKAIVLKEILINFVANIHVDFHSILLHPGSNDKKPKHLGLFCLHFQTLWRFCETIEQSVKKYLL